MIWEGWMVTDGEICEVMRVVCGQLWEMVIGQFMDGQLGQMSVGQFMDGQLSVVSAVLGFTST